jgi:hypothetical protein
MSLSRAILMGFGLLLVVRCGVVGAPKNYVDVHREEPPVKKQESK